MSENITIPAVRVPLVDERGMITREWLPFIQGLYKRSGGFQGFSNQELFGEASTLQSYDELLERIGGAEVQARGQIGENSAQELVARIASLEASNRALVQAVQQLAFGQMDIPLPAAQALADTLDRLTVRGNTRLALQSGQVTVGNPAISAAALNVGGQVNATEYRVADVKVVGAREAGVTAYTAYAGQTVGAAYSQTQTQATDTATRDASAKLAQVVTALRSHGLIGD